jgi:SAM-dependent methyltransferase
MLMRRVRDPDGDLRVRQFMAAGPPAAAWARSNLGPGHDPLPGGGGSIAEWLSRQVGPTGYFLSTDINTRFLDALRAPNLEVRCHDIAADEPPAEAFDLVHTRAVLMHLPQPAKALHHMVASLKPGGWLLAEEPDFGTLVAAPGTEAAAAQLFDKGVHALLAFTANPLYGGSLYRDLEVQGLVDLQTEGRRYVVRGGSPQAENFQLSARQLRDETLRRGLLTEDELETYLALLQDTQMVWLTQTQMAAWGRRPAVRLP